MTDLRVWLESQAAVLRRESGAIDAYSGSWQRSILTSTTTLIDGMLAIHHDGGDEYCFGCDRLLPCDSLRLVAAYVSAVTGSTPPEGAP